MSNNRETTPFTNQRKLNKIKKFEQIIERLDKCFVRYQTASKLFSKGDTVSAVRKELLDLQSQSQQALKKLVPWT